jgi:hypothetical protein
LRFTNSVFRGMFLYHNSWMKKEFNFIDGLVRLDRLASGLVFFLL